MGLPAGSVRALLVILLLAILWGLALRWPANDKLPIAFIYLVYMGVLIVLFFASHGSTIGKHVSDRSALGFPSGFFRLLFLAAYLVLIGYLYHTQRQFTESPEAERWLVLVPFVGFMVGYIFTKIVLFLSAGELPSWYQDLQAWAAIVSVFGLGVIIFLRMFIFPHLDEKLHFDTSILEAVVGTIVALYFGARS